MKDRQSLIKNIVALVGPDMPKLEIYHSDEEILNYIESKVQSLIDTDFQGLLQMLYRLDVNEKDLKENIEKSKPEKVSRLIAEMILKREKQRINTKAKYRQFKSDNDDDEERW